jgi:serine phosphatase RsbU (regulator of sigma subunit)
MPYLRAETGPDSGQRYNLNVDETTIGRHPDCQIVLTEAGRVSRYHAQIVREGGSFFVKDMDSRNGTFLNNEKITPQEKFPLKNGDRLGVCDMLFVFDGLTREQPKPGATVSDDKMAGPLAALLVDDEEESERGPSGSTVLSTLDLTTSSDGILQVSASLEARLAALIEIMRSLGKALALDDVLPQVLNSLFKTFLQADRGFIVLRAKDGTLVPRWSKCRKPDDEDTLRISRTIIKKVMDTKEAILSADATQDNRLDMSASIADLRIRSMMCAPLVDSEGNALGAIQVDTLDQRKRFRQEDLEVLASVAVQAGIAIHNAELHENALRQKEIEQDLEVAQEVQKAFLPQSPPNLEGYDFYDYYRAANHVGGDYFDYIQLPDGRTAVVVADVVGHGIAAAMMMAKLAAEAKYCLASESHPATAITKLNNRLSDVQVDRFVTLIMIVLDPEKHEVTIVNAGHMAPIWRHVDGTIEEPGADEAGLPVGIMDGIDYQQVAIVLAAGESLTLYTDGVNEAMNLAGEQFTIERVRKHVQADSKELKVMGQAIINDVQQFVGDGPQTDDMCLVSVARK